MPFLVFLYVLGAILAFGPTFAYSIMRSMAGKEPQHANFSTRQVDAIGTRLVYQETLREVQRCTKEGITINTFMLERSRALAEFVAHMTKLNRGRAFYATPERLGEYVLVDFVGRRTKRVS